MQRQIFEAEHHAFRDSVTSFLDREVIDRLPSFIADRQIPRSFWRAAGDAGLLGLEAPAEYGGGGSADYRFNAILVEELARVSAGLASVVGLQYAMAMPYLTKVATEEQKRRWLPGACSGEIILAIAMTEPSGGSDLAALRTTAVETEKGWRISGSKTFITNGGSADLIITAARTGGTKATDSITLFAIEATDAGFSRGRKLDKVGQSEADTAELFFDDVEVGHDRVLGEVGRGFVHMMSLLPWERLNAACANLSHTRRHLADTLEYAKQRRAFGSNIGSFQANKFAFAEMFTQLDVSQAFVDHLIVSCNGPGLDPTDAAKAKWWTASVQNEVIDRCLQMYGGYGYMDEYPISRAWRDARVTSIWAGSNEIMKEIIGRGLGL
ncbi:acyl-CoA dehydrogenase family protein [Amycolatopsis sp. GM8]|uniref:acyl-CoA dehydrogenase family protein n=1 Tax=Amycolatopsis sp. GM8 TaxID=2896530 RepID=UPI001F3CF6A8|nr:acyl-CoA dehydrogenase family protein [Amycolatopsis sp. GM8]